MSLDLLAEIDRLRKELDYLSNQRRIDNGDLARAYDEGRDNERTAVVMYLYKRGGICIDVADDIGRGLHIREEGPGPTTNGSLPT